MKSTTFKLGTLALAIFACSFTAQAQDKKEKKAPDFDKMFAKFDSNEDGQLTLEEFKAVKRKNEVPAEKLEARYTKMDEDTNGSVTLEEFKTAMANNKKRGNKKGK